MPIAKDLKPVYTAAAEPAVWPRYAPGMSSFPWDTFITAVVPAAGVLAGAALTGRQTSQATRAADLKRDYATFVVNATALIEHLLQGPPPDYQAVADSDRGQFTYAERRDQFADAVRLAWAVIDLAGSYDAARAARMVADVSCESAPAEARNAAVAHLRQRLDEFLKVARREVGGQNRPTIMTMVRMTWRNR